MNTNKTLANNTENREGRGGSRLRMAAWTVAGLILLLPLLAMQISDNVNWTARDFILIGALILGFGIPFELAVRKTVNAAYRAGAAAALAAAVLLLWINGAVGIIGAEHNDANLMYFGVLAVGMIGVLFARFHPRGMARALFATALAHLIVSVITLAAGFAATQPLKTSILNGFFAALFFGSAWLFHRAGRTRAKENSL
ncbi:MAG: hypothetical protein U5R06_00500 [candidate division KSB1 bacterium]|nr:hypothetical protein [candidate division KSB1 bacterium]